MQYPAGDSDLRRVRKFAEEKAQAIGADKMLPNEKPGGTRQSGAERQRPPLNLGREVMKLSKSVKQTDRMLAAKLLRKLISQKTIFIYWNSMRDPDARVRNGSLVHVSSVSVLKHGRC